MEFQRPHAYDLKSLFKLTDHHHAYDLKSLFKLTHQVHKFL